MRYPKNNGVGAFNKVSNTDSDWVGFILISHIYRAGYARLVYIFGFYLHTYTYMYFYTQATFHSKIETPTH